MVNGQTLIKGGKGIDEVTDERCTIIGPLIGTLGDGLRNEFGLAQVHLHSTASITTGQGLDHVSVDNTTSDKPMTIKTGPGNDLVHFDNSTINDKIAVDTSTGDDEFRAENSSFAGDILLLTGDGTDQMTLLQNDFGGLITWDGGNGTDTYAHDGLNIFAFDPTLLNVEATILI